jgi:Fe-S-cluster containining protein
MRFWPRPAETPLLFGCNQCGDCCREMRIPLSHEDLLAIHQQHPELPLVQWLQFYPVESTHPDALWLEQKPGLLLLRQQQGACLFLQDNRCGIYAYRPRVCRIWPFEHVPGERALRIAPQHSMLVKLACDQTPMPRAEHQQIHDEIDAIAKAYSLYDLRIQQWNQMYRHAESGNTLADFVRFLQAKA